MLWNDLLHRPYGVGLKRLSLASRHGFVGFRFSEVRSVKEGIEGCVARNGEVVVPRLGDGSGVSGMGVIDGTDGLGSGLGSVFGDAGGHLEV